MQHGKVLVAVLGLAGLLILSRPDGGAEERSHPPPRRIDDITAILDRQEGDWPEIAREAFALAGQAPPATDDPDALARFYFRRGQAAVEIGRARQARDDLTRAARFVATNGRGSELDLRILSLLWNEEFLSGNQWRAIETLNLAISRAGHDRRWLALFYGALARVHAAALDLGAAEGALGQASNLREQLRPVERARVDANLAIAHAAILEVKNRFAEAVDVYGRVLAILSTDPALSKFSEIFVARRARALVGDGRLLEAEVEARRAVLGALRKYGRDSPRTASVVRCLAQVLFEQGRYSEAEALTRTTLEIFARAGGSAQSSVTIAEPRRRLVAALVAQERWTEALAEYDAFRQSLNDEALFGSLAATPDLILALIKGARFDAAAEALRSLDARLPGSRGSAEFHALVGMLHAARGNRVEAVRELPASAPFLLGASSGIADELSTKTHDERRRAVIVESYIDLLADIRGTSLERDARLDATEEALKLADVVRSRPVQRALDAAAARNAARTPALAEIIREDQDAKHEIDARYRRLTLLLGRPAANPVPDGVAVLEAEIEALHRKRQALTQRIETSFPAYAQLVTPRPVTVAEARSALDPDEALISIYTSGQRTFLWAVRQGGETTFAVVPLGGPALAELVRRVRKAVDPEVTSLDEIPEFDLAAAHELYARLLEPVKSAWAGARHLLIVAHGPIVGVPFGVLPTRPSSLASDPDLRFSRYRAVPWLARTHSTTVLPSVSSLVTLRKLAPGGSHRRAFVGFGDPLFSRAQADAERARATAKVMTTGSLAITLRSSRKAARLSSASLALLPRLPETAEEIEGMARAMRADPERDIFLRERASEHAVQTTDLSRYRVIAFATHGLSPGEIDGLVEPALALSAPDVAGGVGDGLLTVEKILGLRLDADWIVLSACNTASGHGAGAEAISGLGRAFFYAGARALLVSNWPVETTSARVLVTELFHQQSKKHLTRAEALRRAMLSMIDGPAPNGARFSYAHPIFWAPFTIIGDGGRSRQAIGR